MTEDVALAPVTLPGGGRADHAWSLLSENMRTLFRVTVHAGARDRLVMGTPRTLRALARRGLTDTGDLHRLTPTGRALLNWATNPTNIHLRRG
jgi:hypothetical protein